MGRPVLALQLTRPRFWLARMTRHLLLLVCCAVLSVSARKFCPKEKNGDECRAKQNQYKCGVFFKDLTSKVPLAWLGALPEAVVRARKEGATDDDVISLLGSNVDADSYEGDVCGDTLANTRCYAQMTKVKDEDLDSCGKSLVRKKWSEQAEETMGDYLCGQVHRWLKRTVTTRPTEGTTSRWRSCTPSVETNGKRSQVPSRESWFPKSRCVAQTRASSEGVTAPVRWSRVAKSKKVAGLIHLSI